MKYLFNFLAGVGVLAASQAALHAQTVTVSKTGTADFPSVQAALSSFTVDPNPAEPNVVEITDSETYEETFTVLSSVTVRGTAAERPVLVVQANPLGRNSSGGIVINVPSTETTSSVALHDVVIIPSTVAPPQSTAIENLANNVYLELDNILLTGNDNSNEPVSEDGLLHVPHNPAYHHFGDDGIVLGASGDDRPEGAGVELRMVNSVVTHLRGASGNADGLVTFGTADQYRHVRLEDGNIFSYMGRNGINTLAGGDIVIDAPNEPLRSMYHGEYGAVLGESPNVKSINGYIANNNSRSALYENADTGVRLQLSNAVLAHSTRQNLWLLGAAPGEVTVENVTLMNPISTSYNTLRIDATMGANVTIKDSIIAGNGSSNAANVIYNYGAGTLTLENTALVTEGRYALLSTPIEGPAPVVGSAITNADPDFDAVGYALSDYFLDIRNTAYANLSSSGGALTGGADYVGDTAPGVPAVVTVSKSGPAAYDTIQEAIDSFREVHPESPKKIEVTDGEVYDEEITIHLPVTIEGSEVARPTIAVRANKHGYDVISTTNGYGGIVLGLPAPASTGTIALRNLVVIPSSTDTTQSLFAINSFNNNVYLEVDDLLISGNNGSDAPISADGLSLVASAPEHIHFTFSGIVLGSAGAGRLTYEGAELNMKDTIITNLRGTTGTPGRGLTGFSYGVHVQRANFSKASIQDGCIISYCGSHGAGFNCELDIYAPNERLLVLGNGFNGINMDNSATVIKVIDGANVLENNTGIFDNASGGLKVTLKNVIAANQRAYNIWYRRGSAAAFAENVTVANQGPAFGAAYSQTGSGAYTGTVTFRNSILAGNGQADVAANNINLSKIVLEGTAVVQAGPFALNATQPYQAGAAVTGTPTTTVDPEFVETVNAVSESLYDVTAEAYATADATGGPLGGGGDYISNANVSDWSVY